MISRALAFGILVFLCFVMVAGCNLPRHTGSAGPENQTQTAVAATLIRVKTGLAAGESPHLSGLETFVPTGMGLVPTHPPFTTLTPNKGPTTPPPCGRAVLVREITIPDGTVIPPGSQFTKTWELTNTGSCTWNSDFVFVSGGENALGFSSAALTTGSEKILPGQKGRVSLLLQAPETIGVYEGSWKLRTPDGKIFGVGFNSDAALTVNIRTANEYYFAQNLCSARWENAAGELDCPMTENDPRGFAIRVNEPELETGGVEDEVALVIAPPAVPNGEIGGHFPAVMVPAGSHFKAIIGCYSGFPGCNVQMIATYRVEGGVEKTLGEWFEVYDEAIRPVDIDLATYGLAGKPVSFGFKVRTLDSREPQRVFWLLPRLIP